MWLLPFNAHRYLIEPLGGDHAFTMALVRFVKFLQNIQKSSKMAVQCMLTKVLKNVSTVTGKNVRYIKNQIGSEGNLLKMSPRLLKKKLSFCPMNADDQWRINLIRELTNVKHEVLCLVSSNQEMFLSKDELMDIVHYASSS